MDLEWEVWGIEKPEKEYRFHPGRKWRYDFAWPSKKVAVEIEGGVWTKGRHTRGSGFLGDMAKYNEAARLGWRVFRFQPKDLKTGVAQTFMLTVFGGMLAK